MENWLSIAALIYLAAMILLGHYKGVIRMAVSAVALIVTLLAANIALPQVTGYLRENTQVYQTVEEAVRQAVGIDAGADQGSPSEQRRQIEEMNLPGMFKSELLENNNNEVYRLMGVESFSGYVTGYLVNNIVNLAVYLLLFAIIFGILEITARCLDLVARLPVISGVNKLAGAVLGGVEGLIFLWLIFLLIAAFSTTKIGMELNQMIESSTWLSFLYHHNLLSMTVMTVIRGLL